MDNDTFEKMKEILTLLSDLKKKVDKTENYENDPHLQKISDEYQKMWQWAFEDKESFKEGHLFDMCKAFKSKHPDLTFAVPSTTQMIVDAKVCFTLVIFQICKHWNNRQK